MRADYWNPAEQMQKWTDEEWKAAFEAEGPFSWSEWWGSGYPAFKTEMEEQGAEFSTYTVSSGKCIRCDDRVAITDLSIEFRHQDSSTWKVVTDREVELVRYHDPCCCGYCG